MKNKRPSSFGTRVCLYCSLTIADYLNGRLYSAPPLGVGFFHDDCFEHIQHRHKPINQGGNEIMPILTEAVYTTNEPWDTLLVNLMVLELLTPDSEQTTWPHIAQLEDTMCYYHAGTFTRNHGDSEQISAPFHLAHTGPIAILVDAQTGEILTDLSFDTDLFMMVEYKQALIMKSRIGMIMLQIHDLHLFQLWKQFLPPYRLNAATHFYHQFKKERTVHV
ncbi:hypothetical protein ABLT31_35335 [Ammoniphilus sp. 3BR4]